MLTLLLSLCAAHAHEALPVALEQIDQALAADPESGALHLRRHALHMEAGELEAAAQDLRQAALHGEPVAAHRALLVGTERALRQALDARALAAGPRARPDGEPAPGPWAQVHAALAELLLADGRWQQALEQMDAVVALEPSPDRYLRRARMAQPHDLERAIAGLESAPGVACQLERVALLRAADRDAQALEIVDALLVQRPDHPGWLLLRAELSGMWGGPYRRRARTVLERRISEHATPADQALLEQTGAGGCGGAGSRAGLLWLPLLLWRRRC